MSTMHKLPSAQGFLRQLQRVPYLASKNVYRVLHHFLDMDDEQAQRFIAALSQARSRTVYCSKCFAWQEREQNCLFCSDKKREKFQICVVETWHDLCAIERAGCYRGVYHVLGGSLCPLDGVGPDDLKIKELVLRIKEAAGDFEIILALNQTPEGDATAAYIARQLAQYDVHVTSLARGVPVGGSLEYVDRLTLGKAIADRKTF